MQCPYYRKIGVEKDPSELKAYCEGDKLNALRVPSMFEETHYCTTHQYPACRVFQARQGAVEHKDEAETSQGE